MNILLAHGSSDSRHATQAQLLADRAAEELGAAIELRFLSSKKMPDGAHVLPLLLGEGWHAKHDIARLAAASDCTILPSLSGRAASIAGMARDLATDALSGEVNAIFAIYHFHGFEAVSSELKGLENRFSRMALAAIYSSPNVGEVLELWNDEGVENILVQPLVLFEGRTMEKLRRTVAKSGADALTGPTLSSHAGFPAFIADCFREST
jgi:sirohydrochlorin ferrochelatase